MQNGAAAEEFIGLRPKMYSLKIGEKEKKTGKGIHRGFLKIHDSLGMPCQSLSDPRFLQRWNHAMSPCLMRSMVIELPMTICCTREVYRTPSPGVKDVNFRKVAGRRVTSAHDESKWKRKATCSASTEEYCCNPFMDALLATSRKSTA